MAYVITDPCIGTKDTACVDVCPVDCIHPRQDEPEFAEASMLYIHPEECIDCGACIPACPVSAIYQLSEVPQSQQLLIQANAEYYNVDGVKSRAEDIVKEHISQHPETMSLPASERQAKH